MTGKAFIDSNVWIYLLSSDDPARKEQAGRLLAKTRGKVISWQVVNEVCVNLLRTKRKDEPFVRLTIDFMRDACEVVECSEPILNSASELREHHGVSFWDSLIVATALAAGCSMLVSEDMQDGRKFGRMVVRNIFGTT